jgi:hypothetical protein
MEHLAAYNDRIDKLEARTLALQWALIIYVIVCSLLVIFVDL